MPTSPTRCFNRYLAIFGQEVEPDLPNPVAQTRAGWNQCDRLKSLYPGSPLGFAGFQKYSNSHFTQDIKAFELSAECHSLSSVNPVNPVMAHSCHCHGAPVWVMRDRGLMPLIKLNWTNWLTPKHRAGQPPTCLP